MTRNLNLEIWGVAGGTSPSSIKASTEDGEYVVLNGTHKEVTISADDLIALARMLEGMRTPKPGV